MNIKKLELNEYKEDGYVVSQHVYDDIMCVFSVYNLTDCPEDAMICRDLFNADDYIRAIKYGIELAKRGYDDVSLELVQNCEEEDEETK